MHAASPAMQHDDTIPKEGHSQLEYTAEAAGTGAAQIWRAVMAGTQHRVGQAVTLEHAVNRACSSKLKLRYCKGSAYQPKSRSTKECGR